MRSLSFSRGVSCINSPETGSGGAGQRVGRPSAIVEKMARNRKLNVQSGVLVCRCLKIRQRRAAHGEI